jgi:hypothetical protein
MRRGIPPVALAAALLVASSAWASADGPDRTIELRVFRHAAIDASALRVARASVAELLGAAGIRVEWRACPLDAAACRSGSSARAIVVRLVPTRLADRYLCGCVVPHAADGDVVMIFVPCQAAQLRTVRLNMAARSEPSLATLDVGHLIGLTLAHEIGHVLGLVHAAEGVMQARFGMEDLRRLRLSQLAFGPRERLRMQQALAPAQDVPRRRDALSPARRAERR